MALKAVVENLDDVDEQFRGEYKEHSDAKGKKSFVLDIEGTIDAHPIVKPLKEEAGRRRINETKLTQELEKVKPLLAFGDPADLVAKLDKYPELEAAAAGKLDETKLNELVEHRIKGKLTPIERERDKLRNDIAERDKKISEYTAAEVRRKVTGALGRAAKELKVADSAIEDIEMYSSTFEITEDGSVVTRDGVGVPPGLTPKQWLEDMQPKRPHWWGTTQGGGATGGRGANVLGNNPWTAENWNMTAQGAYLRQHGSEKAAAAAKAAGTTVGGPKPAPKQKAAA